MNDAIRIARMESKLSNLEDKSHDHEVRVREIEKTIWKAFGVYAAIQVVATGVIMYIKH